jgi:hypothetical protein
MSARASSFGDEGLFVCKTPSRAYDIDENRVLVAALDTIREAAHATEHANERGLEDPLVRAARRSGNEASRFIDHPSLASVTRERPKPRAIKRTRSGKHRKSYQPALDMLERASNPLDVDSSAGCAMSAPGPSTPCSSAWSSGSSCGAAPACRRSGSSGVRLFSGPVQYYHAPGWAIVDTSRASSWVSCSSTSPSACTIPTASAPRPRWRPGPAAAGR